MSRVVHKKMPEPPSPGPWVDDIECVCGARYKDFRAFTSSRDAFAQGQAAVKSAQAENPEGVFLSRGPVLWAARLIKLTEWYSLHRWCCPERWEG